MKKTALIAAAVCAALAICAIFAWWRISAWLEPASIAEATQKSLGAPLVIKEKPRLSLFPPGLEFGQASWRQSLNKGGSFEISAAGCAVAVEILPLLGGKLEIGSIDLDSPVMTLDAGSGEESQPAECSHAGRAPAWPGKLRISRLSARQGAFVWQDGASQGRLKKINFVAENLADNANARVKCDFAVEPGENGAYALSGNLAFQANLRYSAPALSFSNASATFTATDGGFISRLSPLQLALEGSLNLSDMDYALNAASLSAPQGTLKTNGAGNLAKGVFAGPLSVEIPARGPNDSEPGQSEALLVNCAADFASGSLVLNDIAIKYGMGDGAGHLAVKFDAKAGPAVEGAIELGEIRLPAFASESSRPGEKSNPAESPGSLDSSWPRLDVKLSVAALLIQKLRFEHGKARLKGAGGRYSASDIGFGWCGGEIRGRLDADIVNERLGLDLGGSGINLGKALDEFGFDGLKNGSAAFSMFLGADGSLFSPRFSTLSGNGRLECSGAQIPALKEIAHMLPVPGGRGFVFPEQVESLSARWAIVNGIAAIKPVALQAGSLKIDGSAVADLSKAALDGSAHIHVLDANLPIVFKGPIDDLSWSIGGNFFEELKRLIP